MKKFIPIIITVVVLLAFFVVPAFLSGLNSQVYLPQQDTGYEISAYDVNIDINEDGSFDVSEKIVAYFKTSDSHGIYRWLPIVQKSSYYKNGKLVEKNFKASVSNVLFNQSESSSQTYLVDEYRKGNYYFLQMGSTSYVVAGSSRTYSFSYTYDYGDDREKGLDMLYYNIIGTGWDTSISNLTFTINFPKAVESEGVNFYVGKYGESSTNSDCISYTFDGVTLEGRCERTLAYGEAVTVFKELEQGYFSYHKNITLDIILLVLVVLFLVFALLVFLKKRKKDPIVEVVEFKAPQGITPTEAGYINDGKITGDDLSSLIVYWASKGFVKIKEEGKKTQIIKVATDEQIGSDMKQHERILFSDMFRGDRNAVYADDLNLKVDTGFKCKNSVETASASYFDKTADRFFLSLIWFAAVIFAFFVYKSYSQSVLRGMSVVLQVLLIVVSFIGVVCIPTLIKYKDKCKKSKFVVLLLVDLIAIFAPIITLMFLMEGYCDTFGAKFYITIIPTLLLLIYPHLERYTEQGRGVLGQIRGLKNYILVAEKDKMEVMVGENPELFYQVLPYAYVLGVSDVFMKKFEDVEIAQPDWYQTDSESWVTFILVNHCLNHASVYMRNNMTSYVASQAKNISNSIGGGSSGGGHSGGFSGGGHGGGGGGRW